MFDPARAGYGVINSHTLDRSPHGSHIKILKYIPSNSRVLDVGCSSGYFCKDLKDRGCYVIGVEVSEAEAEAAKLYCDQVIIGDVEEMTVPFSSGFFDVIIFGDVLEHLNRPDLTLTRLGRFLAPTGMVIASIPNVAQVRIRLKLLLGKFEYCNCGILDLTHLRFFTLKTAKKLFTQSGYRIVKVDYSGWASVLKILPTLLAYQFIIIAKPRNSKAFL